MAGIEGHGLAGASIEDETTVLFASADEGEATLPELRTRRLLLVGLQPLASYEVQVTSGFAPGSPAWRTSAEAGGEGTLSVPWDGVRDGRLRLKRVR